MTTATARKTASEKGLLIAALLVVAFSIAAAAFGRYTDIGTIRVPMGEPVDMRDLSFVERPNGEITVSDAATGAIIHTIAVDQDGFIRGALRGLARARNQRAVSLDTPYRVIRWTTGRTTLSDTATGQRIDLDAFGSNQVVAFSRFLHNGGKAP